MKKIECLHCLLAKVSTALRPFYFLVHPDLFGLFPKERAVNEDSLKALRAHLGLARSQSSAVEALFLS